MCLHIEIFFTLIHSHSQKSQNKAKWPNIFFMAKHFFQGQTSNKKDKIELFGRKKAKLPTLISVNFRELQLVQLPRISTSDSYSNYVTPK